VLFPERAAAEAAAGDAEVIRASERHVDFSADIVVVPAKRVVRSRADVPDQPAADARAAGADAQSGAGTNAGIRRAFVGLDAAITDRILRREIAGTPEPRARTRIRRIQSG